MLLAESLKSNVYLSNMGDIPMTDIVIRQPTSHDPTVSENCDVTTDESHFTGNNNPTCDEHSESPSTIGLGPLRNAATVTIKQRIRAFDIISLCTGCEVRNQYISPSF